MILILLLICSKHRGNEKGALINMTYVFIIKSYPIKIHSNGVGVEKGTVEVDYLSVCPFSCQDNIT